jgi:hypothetical protein
MDFEKARLAHYAEKANKQSGTAALLHLRPSVQILHQHSEPVDLKSSFFRFETDFAG